MPPPDAPGESDLRDGVPWGRPPVAGIPVPPFSDRGERRAFVLALAEHVALTAGAAGPISLAAYGLAAALSDLGGRSDTMPELPPWVLRVALATYFPAPWTPQELVAAIEASGLTPDLGWYHGPHELGFHSDPDLHARRDRRGRWVARFRERGVDRLDAEIEHDDDMALFVMSTVRGSPYPYGWQPSDAARVEALSASARPTLEAWQRHATLPYLTAWSDRSENG